MPNPGERTPPKTASHNQQVAYLSAVVSEIRMLIDYVAGSAQLSLTKLKVVPAPPPQCCPQAAGAAAPVGFAPIADVLNEIATIEASLQAEGAKPDGFQFARVQTIRDALGVLVRPASGLTVAYTALVTGNRRGEGAESRAGMAGRAYPGWTGPATRHRWAQRFIIVLTLLVMMLAIWESTKVALGKSLLQNLDLLRVQQTALTTEKNRVEARLDKPAAPGVAPAGWLPDTPMPLQAFALCDRPLVISSFLFPPDGAKPPVDARKIPLRLYGSSEERDVCERDHLLAYNLELVHTDLTHYQKNWPAMVGPSFHLIGNFASHFLGALTSPFPPAAAAAAPACTAPPCPAAGDDVEFMVAPILLVWGNYVLPILFSFLGSAIYVILNHSNKVRDSLLHPKDRFLSAIRLVLGVVTGATIGLFFSSAAPALPPGGAAGTALISSLTLSASGVAFLAGFGVEGVFTMLESVVSRVFPVQTDAK